MNNWIKSTIGVGCGGFLILLAMYGKQLAEALHALWLLLLQASTDAPLGLSSFIVALVLATLSRWFLRKWTPTFRRFPLPRDFLIDLAALIIGIAVVWLQMSQGDGVARLNALWIGLVAGLLAPLLYNGLATAGGLIARAAAKAEKTPCDDAGGKPRDPAV